MVQFSLPPAPSPPSPSPSPSPSPGVPDETDEEEEITVTGDNSVDLTATFDEDYDELQDDQEKLEEFKEIIRRSFTNNMCGVPAFADIVKCKDDDCEKCFKVGAAVCLMRSAGVCVCVCVCVCV